MKSIAVFCLFVAGVSCGAYSIRNGAELVGLGSGYGGQRLVEEFPQLTRVIENRPAIRVAEPAPLRLDNSYGQRQLRVLESPLAVRVLQEDIPITRFNHVINPNSGEYSVDFAGANGIVSKESGFLKAVPVARVVSGGQGYGYGNELRSVEEVVGVAQTKSGETSWCSPEGLRFTLTYTADETGYHPQITKGLCHEPIPAYQPTRLNQTPAYEQTRFVQAPAYEQTRFVQAPAYEETRFVQEPAYEQTRLVQAPAY